MRRRSGVDIASHVLQNRTAVEYSTVLYSAVQKSTVNYSTLHYRTALYSIVQYSTIYNDTTQYIFVDKQQIFLFTFNPSIKRGLLIYA